MPTNNTEVLKTPKQLSPKSKEALVGNSKNEFDPNEVITSASIRLYHETMPKNMDRTVRKGPYPLKDYSMIGIIFIILY